MLDSPNRFVMSRDHNSESEGDPQASNGTGQQGQNLRNGPSKANGTVEAGGDPSRVVGGARPKVRPLVLKSSSPVSLPNGILPLGERRNGSSGADLESQGGNASDNNDDTFVYRYKGGTGAGVSGEGGSSYAADLPKSFYTLDVGSDSEPGSYTPSLPGVTGAGQSNLSTELAALIQSEMASEEDKRRQRQRATNGAPYVNGRRPNSPELMDFLEMDFDGGSQSDSDSRDSGQGGTETNSLLDAVLYDPDDFEPGESRLESIQLRQRNLRLEDSEANEAVGAAMAAENVPAPALSRATRAGIVGSSSGVTSAPAVTPMAEQLTPMVRSTSLNSPLASASIRSSNSGPPGFVKSSCLACTKADTGSLPSIQGSQLNSAENPEVNRVVCGAKLLQRESFIFSQALGSPPINPASLSVDPRKPSEPSTYQAESLTDKVMIWSESEACKRQVSQIGTSACGATSLINVLLALNHPFSVDEVSASIKTRLRAEGSSLPRYIFSRSNAGATHEDLMEAMNSVSQGTICSRFFHLFPRRKLSLCSWLSKWVEKGAVPVLTLNPQRGALPGQTIPDAWHHQMVFGVGPKGIYCTNPLECVSESTAMEQLSSPSVLLVRRKDIVTRFDDSCDLAEFTTHNDDIWDNFNVLGQVVNVLREHQNFLGDPQSQLELTQHIKIPAAYKSGVTLFMKTTNEHVQELLSCPDLDLLQP